jgi:hypothetical protein
VTRGQETKRHSPVILALLCLAVFPTPACTSDGSLYPTEKAALNPATVNLDHFEHLFTEIEVGGNRLERSLASADFANSLSPSLSRPHYRKNADVTLSLILDRGNT